jgi:hypothetical protein
LQQQNQNDIFLESAFKQKSLDCFSAFENHQAVKRHFSLGDIHMNTHGFPFKLSACAIAVLISACGGGSATAPATIPGSSGLAIDDYIKGATVLCDANGNSISDAGEATTKTDSIGFFKFTPICASSLVVTGGTNIDTGLPFIGKLKAPAGSTVVTPLTTLLSEGMTNDQISAALGLPTGTNVSSLDPARKEDGKLVRPDVFKKTLALQQLLQKTAEALAALIPGSDASSLYGDVAAAMASTMRTSPTLVVGGQFDQGATASLVQSAATRLQARIGASVNAATLGALMAPALKVQADQILGASDTNLTNITTAVQGDARVPNFVGSNRAALNGAPNTVTALADQLKTQVMPAAPPPPTDTNVLLNFDDVTVAGTGFDGGEGSAVSSNPPAGGGTGNAYEVKRLDGKDYAGAFFLKAIPLTAERRTISARVYSPVANIPMVIKLENAQSSSINSGDVQANETVVQGWQTLTWTVASENISKTLNKIVLLPRLGTVDTAPAKSYFFDNITLIVTATPVPTTEPSCATTALQCLNFRESTIGAQGFEGLVAAEISNDPVTGAANKVLKLVKAVGNAAGANKPWAGATVRTMRTGTDPNFVDTIDRVGLGTSKIVTVRSYSSAPVGTKITLKLENGLDGAQKVFAEAVTTQVNGWETLTFNFANLTLGAFDAAHTYNKASIFPAWTEVGGTSSLTAEGTFYFDELKYSAYTAPAPTPAPSGATDLLNFDTLLPTSAVGEHGAQASTVDTAPPAGGSGSAYKVLRNGGQTYALAVLKKVIPFTAERKTISARVYSPTAGIPIQVKLEAGGPANATADVSSNEVVVVGWQTLTWTYNSVNPALTWDTIVLLPNNGTLDPSPGKSYYFDDFKLLAAASGSGSGATGGVLTFSSGFSSAQLTSSNGKVDASGGSNLDNFGCNGEAAWCGRFFDGAGANSYSGFYYQTPTPASALYSQIEVFGPNVTGFNLSGDTGGVTISNQTKVNFTFNQNAQWFGSTNNKFGVIITLGKRYAIDGGCRLQLHGVKTPTSSEATAYSMNLRNDFRVAADCGAGIPPTDVAAALAASPVISSVKFIGAAGGSTIYGRNDSATGANLSVKDGSTYPTTVVVKGAITFD